MSHRFSASSKKCVVKHTVFPSLLILFICSLPMILKINPNNSEDKSGYLKSNEVRSENLEIADSGNKSDEWEEASEEDLQSGNFETI